MFIRKRLIKSLPAEKVYTIFLSKIEFLLISSLRFDQKERNEMKKRKNLMCNEQVLNLFLALLLSNFGSSNLSAPTADNDTNKIAEAIDRIARFVKWIKRNVLYLAKMMRAKLTNQISDQAPGEGPSNSWKEGLYPIRSLAVCAV